MEEKKILHILWTNADPVTARLMVMMYATNAMARRWWDEVTVVIWGATAALAAEDESIQEAMRIAAHVGVKFSACVACARELGVVERLESLGIEVIAWGQPLSELLQQRGHLLTI